MATLQTNPMHEEMVSDEEPITDLQSGAVSGHMRPGTLGVPAMMTGSDELLVNVKTCDWSARIDPVL